MIVAESISPTLSSCGTTTTPRNIGTAANAGHEYISYAAEFGFNP
jgi:hypothetical protein